MFFMELMLAKSLTNWRNVLGERNLIAFCVGPAHELILLSLGREPDYRYFLNGASFAKLFSEKENDFKIHCYQFEQWWAIDLQLTKENFHHIQPLPKGLWLLVRARATDKYDLNAHVYGKDGIRLQSFAAEEAIEDVQSTSKGEIWFSYFDQNYDNGVVKCRNMQGELLLDGAHTDLDKFGHGYALNVCSSNDVWILRYPSFPLIRIV